MRLSGVGGALRARARRFGVVRFSGVGGALRAPLGPVVAPLASSLRTPFRPHPPLNFLARSGTAVFRGDDHTPEDHDSDTVESRRTDQRSPRCARSLCDKKDEVAVTAMAPRSGGATVVCAAKLEVFATERRCARRART